MVGSSSLRVGRGDDPDVEVSIRVFIGFMKHPSGRPRRSKFLQRNSMSSSGVQVETSSTNPLFGTFFEEFVEWAEKASDD